jgi:hypothetical protein
MIKIEFYIKDSEGNEQVLTDMKLPSNPFKVGDKISLSLNWLRQSDLIGYIDSFRETVKKNYDFLETTVHLKKVVLVSEDFILSIDVLHQNSLTVSYYCEIVD